jgi:hypothetical protein
MAKQVKLEKVGERLWVSNTAGAVVQFTSRRKNFDSGSIRTVAIGNQSAMVKAWGASNNLPHERESLIAQNAYLPNLHIVQRNILLGDEFVAFKKIREGGQTRIEEVDLPQQLLNKFDVAMIDSINEELANQYIKHLTGFVEFVWQKDGSLFGADVKKCRDVRAERQDKFGKIPQWWWSNAWQHDPKVIERVLMPIASYDPMLVDPRARRNQGKFLFPIMDKLLDDGYYPIPPVDGIRDIVELSNGIPQFHIANLRNGYNLRWHIKIPEDYFYDYEAVNKGLKTEDEAVTDAKTAEEDFIEKMNLFLAGMENAGRAVYTKKRITLEKEYPGIEIIALNYDMKDDALLKLNEMTTTTILSNQGVPPALASIQLPKQFGSGSEIRNALYLYQIIQAPFARKKIVSWLDVVRRVEGIPADIFFGFKDREITTLDKNASGQQGNPPI